jgi:hypothetical protein
MGLSWAIAGCRSSDVRPFVPFRAVKQQGPVVFDTGP